MTENFNSILEYYPKQEVSISTKLLIQQDVAFTFERLVHNYMLNRSKEAKEYGTYLCLIQANPDYIGNYISELTEYVDEEVLEKIVTYLRMGEIPYYLFVNKVMFDINSCSGYNNKTSVPSLLLIMLLKTMRASLIAYNQLHKALMEDYESYDDKVKEVIDFAYSWYLEYPTEVKKDYMKALHPQNNKERDRAIKNEMSIFTEVLLDMFNSKIEWEIIEGVTKGMLPRYTALWKDMDLGGMLLNAIDEGDLSTTETTKPNSKKSVGSKMSCFATDLCGWGPNGETPAQMKENLEQLKKQAEVDKQLAEDEDEGVNIPDGAKVSDLFLEIFKDISALRSRVDNLAEKVDSHINEKYNDITSGTNKNEAVTLSNEKQIFILKKVAKDGSSRVMWKGMYNSLEEAEKRKEELCNNPDIIKNFDFVIEVGK